MSDSIEDIQIVAKQLSYENHLTEKYFEKYYSKAADQYTNDRYNFLINYQKYRTRKAIEGITKTQCLKCGEMKCVCKYKKMREVF